MYDQVTARFIQEDEYRGDPNESLSLSLYTYCHNEPMMYDDPTGHFWHILAGALIGGIVNTAMKVGGDIASGRLKVTNLGSWKSNAKSYAGAFVSGAITWAVAAATGGASLGAMMAANAAASFAGSAASQYIECGKVNVKAAAYEGIVGGLTAGAAHVASKALAPVMEKAATSIKSTTTRVINKASNKIGTAAKVVEANTGKNMTVNEAKQLTNCNAKITGEFNSAKSNEFKAAMAERDVKIQQAKVAEKTSGSTQSTGGAKLLTSGKKEAAQIKLEQSAKGSGSDSVIHVDPQGNAIKVKPGENLEGRPDGKVWQVKDANGNQTGDRYDGLGHPTQKDPLAQEPHGHRVDDNGRIITDSKGNPHLPANPPKKK